MEINLLGIPSLIISISIIVLIIAILVRVFATWFGFDERFAFIRFLARLTDPILDPVRRIVPPMRSIDFSFLIVTFLLITLRYLLLQSLPPLW
ncbi:MAG TPA: YggT family protein [Ktedonobacteraceae bacterium]|nr:YggT family protein [Ktedonobacteraceae bacterium]